MKIAIIGQKGIPSKFGGIEKHVQELSTRLVSLGHDVTVYTRPWYTSKLMTEYKGVKLVSLPSVRTKHLDAISHTLLATIHALFGKYDIIHYHAVGPSLLAFIPRIFSKAKVVITFHCLDRMLNKWGFFAKLVLYIGEYTANKFAHVTIARKIIRIMTLFTFQTEFQILFMSRLMELKDYLIWKKTAIFWLPRV